MSGRILVTLLLLSADAALAQRIAVAVANQNENTFKQLHELQDSATTANYVIVIGEKQDQLFENDVKLNIINDCPPTSDQIPNHCFLLLANQNIATVLRYVVEEKPSLELTFPTKTSPSKKTQESTGACATDRDCALEAAAKAVGMLTPKDASETYAGDQAILLFDSKGRPLNPPQRQVDEDDTVAIAVVADPNETIESFEVTTCSVPTVLRVGGKIPTGAQFITVASKPKKKDRTAFRVVTATRCSSDDGIQLKAKVTTESSGETSDLTFTVPTLPLYRLTLGLGLLYDFSRVSDFRASALKGESVPVITQNQHFAGLTTVAFISLRIIRADTVRNRWDSKYGVLSVFLNPTVGISLSAPLENLYFAENFEPYPGLGVLVGYHFFSKQYLSAGYQVGDRYLGGSTVPVDKRWNGHGFFLGLALDSSLISTLLGVLNR